MEPLPLVPKSTTLSNHDTTHILREAFQDFFSEQTFPKNIANNAEKYKLKMIALKENGIQANTYQQHITTYLEDVRRTEEKLLQRHAEYFIAKDSIINDPQANEKNRLKRIPVVRELSASMRKKHGLVDLHHLLPPLPERVLDFTITSNRHLCESCETEAEIYPVTLLKKPRSPTRQSRTGSVKKLVYFEPSPREILFDDYELNVTYMHINEHIELIAGSFRLYPAFFVINENEFVEVILSFYPKKYGLFVETVYMLCHNNTFEELDLVGDGVYFEKSYISFDLKKKDCKPFFLDYQSEYCLHLGKCLSCTKHPGFVRVINNSPLNLSYRWTLRRSENLKSKDFKHMAPHWITIKRIATLPACSTTNFDIIFHPETATAGLYRIVLSLYVENIPEISLRDLEEFTVLEKNDYDRRNKLLDVLMGEIELLCEVEKIDVVIEPNPLNVPFQLSPYSDSHCEQIVTVTSNTSFPLTCEWFAHAHNRKVRIEPKSFELTDSMQCKVSITRIDIDNVDEEFFLYVKEGALKLRFKIQAGVIIPRGSLSIATIDFGHVMENFVYNRSFLVQNTSKDTIQWKIAEDVVLLQEDTKVVAMELSECLVPNHGTLHHGESCNVQYTANTQNCGEWLSYLKLYTNFTNTQEKADFACGVHFIVCKPEGIMHTDTSELPILCPDDVLYVDVPIDAQICLHNSGNIVLIYAFGIIRVHENSRIDVKITAKAMGYFEDVYIPMFILGCDKVKLVKLMCLVTDIIVTIFLPDAKEEYKAIVWPQIVPESPEEIDLGEYAPMYPYKFQTSNVPDLEESGDDEYTTPATTTTYTKEPSIDDDIIEIKPPPNDKHAVEDEQERFHDIDRFMTLLGTGAEGSYVKLSASEDDMPQAEYIIEDTPMTTSRRGTTTTTTSTNATRTSSSGDVSIAGTSSSLRSMFNKFFGSELTVQTYSIEFAAVPLRTRKRITSIPTSTYLIVIIAAVKRTIRILNMTPGSGSVNAEVVNFYASDQPKDELNELLAEMNMAKSTLWDDQIVDNGIVIRTDQTKNVIGNHEQVEIDVWVYANTWGLYLDEILIDISGLTPFCASLLVEVVGSPIAIPMAQNSIRQEATIRFGTVPYKSKKVKRRLKVVNTSVVPLTVSWHMFVNFYGMQKAFSLLFDMPDNELLQFSEELVKGQLLLTNKYFGEPNTHHFEIEPMMSHIEPKSYVYVDITAVIDKFGSDLVGKHIEANLAGLIRIPTPHMYLSNILTRPADVNLPITRVRLTLQILSADIEIDDSIRTIDMMAFATNIMEKEFFSYKETLVLRNTNTYPTSVYVEIEKPFRICQIKTPALSLTQLNTSVQLLPKQCMQLTIEVSFVSEDVLKLVETLRTAKDVMSLRPNFEENSMTLSRLLNVYQNGHLHRVIPLDMKIFYPLFKVFPANVKLDNVYVGDTAKGAINLRNLTGPQLRYEIYRCYQIKEFNIKPEIGIIPSISDNGTCCLNVFFTPSEPKTYEEWIAITTHIPHHYVIINIAGTGTYDEKFHKPGLH
ncbi:deleted in lung and esophageal cancer protein 1 [Holotrichia oblita]|uniref:Deleted in lung and esophageal cancer protein 1 n=1 Tax=Holotrichia oblita TaxID=644536 RepID=A0ACB9T0S5_HOLOL|nr:deleted in lung and esophageal cancer protein 1 [Holotrichia oblita]